jgi:NADP-dependent 3-hydroxy acid dehydrogenase YdfG
MTACLLRFSLDNFLQTTSNKMNLRRLEKQRVVLTGGASGIGLGIAHALAAEGCQLMICGRRAEKLAEAAAELPATQTMTHALDVGDRDACRMLFEKVHAQWGGVDILINAAGVNIKNRSMHAMTPEQWDDVMRTNATGAYNCMYYVLPQMRINKNGLIINISSIAGKRATALGGIAYAASKFAMTALGTATSNEENAHGIRVTNIYPGEVDTPILEHRPTPVSAERRAVMLKPEDVASLVVAIACLPPRAHVPELVIKPTVQEYV